MKKHLVKLLFLIIGLSLGLTLSVFAYSIFAQEVGYTPIDTSWDVDNSKEALDDLYSTVKCDSTYIGTTWKYNYSAFEDIMIVPCKGRYKLEVWGAQGGSYNTTYKGGYGAYAVGEVNLDRLERLYINVGGAGINSAATGTARTLAGGYNGGGNAGATSTAVAGFASGGGATHIAKVSGLLYNLSSYAGTKMDNYYVSTEILIVAGGGGGSWYQTSGWTITLSGGSGGGIVGVSTYGTIGSSSKTFTTGGTQIYGGYMGSYNRNVNYSAATFGYGGEGGGCGSGSGGGFFGGGYTECVGGAGGSSYIANPKLSNKSMFCYGCQESSVAETKTISTTGSSSARNTSGCPNGYSGSYIEKCAKEGNGFARITYLGN